MTKIFGTLVLSAVVVLAPALGAAQDTEWQNEPAPQTAQPQELPPAPPAEQPAVPQEQPQAYAQPQAQTTAAVPPGQWVYTQQYGWIWMPYSDAYTQVPATGYGTPYAYVYSPAWSCWTWLAAPWVWGVGPWPWFGAYGAVYYGWYGHGWWRYPSQWHYYAPYGGYAGYRYPPRPAPYRPAPGAAYRGGYAYRGSMAAPHGGATYARPYGGGATYARPYGGGATYARPYGGGATYARPSGGGSAFGGHAGGQGFAPRGAGGGHVGGGRGGGGGHVSGGRGGGHGR